MKAITLPDQALEIGMTAGLIDHFVGKDTTVWTTTATDTGTAAMSDAAGGVIVLSPSDGTVADNDEVYLLTTNEIVKIAADKPIAIKARLQFTQAATNAANVAVGIMNAVAANSIQDNGAGLAANFSGAAFYCRDGSLNWHVIYSDGTTQTIQELTAAASLNKIANPGASTAFQLLEIDILPKSATLLDVVFKINGTTVFKMNDRTFASATEAMLFVGAKNGTAAQQAVNVDAISVHQKI
jgi:hypothetical protein